MSLRSPWVALVAVTMLAASTAWGKEGELVLPGKRVPISQVEGATGKEVVLFGPFEATPEMRKGTEVDLYVPIQYGGKICYVDPYVVNGEKLKNGKLKVDPTDYSGSFATMEDGHTEPAGAVFGLVDYEVNGSWYRPLTHFRTWKKVYIALIVRSGEVTIGSMRVSPYGPSERPEGPAPTKGEKAK